MIGMTVDLASAIRGKQLLRAGEAAELRSRAGLSQGLLARTVGASPGAVSLWERGEREPTGEAGIRYCETLAMIERQLLIPTAGAVA